jgi:uncharacterized protein (DUF488 family)
MSSSSGSAWEPAIICGFFDRLAPDRLQRIPRGYGRSYRQGFGDHGLVLHHRPLDSLGHRIHRHIGRGRIGRRRQSHSTLARQSAIQFGCAGGALREHGIDYVHLAELGGRRGRARSGGSSPNSFWQNQSFRNYADYAMTEAFQHGFARFRSLGRAKPCAIMCSEALWWRCHRRIIADYLIFAGQTVVHILALGKMETATPTPRRRSIWMMSRNGLAEANLYERILVIVVVIQPVADIAAFG